jgi:hypothetical protein
MKRRILNFLVSTAALGALFYYVPSFVANDVLDIDTGIIPKGANPIEMALITKCRVECSLAERTCIDAALVADGDAAACRDEAEDCSADCR